MNCFVASRIGTFNLLDVAAIIPCALAKSPSVFVTPLSAISSLCISAAYVAAAPAPFTASTVAPIPAPTNAPAGPPTAPPAKAS